MTHPECGPSLRPVSQEVHTPPVQNLFPPSISFLEPGLACVSSMTPCLGKERQEADAAIKFSVLLQPVGC